jgi:hypothetical protein
MKPIHIQNFFKRGLTMGINSNIRFIEFSPSYRIQSFIQNLTERVSGGSPSDSIVRVILEKTGLIFTGNLRISSFAGVFEARVSAGSPELAMREMADQMMFQLAGWKASQKTAE